MNKYYSGVEITPLGKFSARISLDRKRYYLGTFDSSDEASRSIQNFMKEKNLIFSKHGRPIKNLVGNTLNVVAPHLKNANTKSCGCFKTEIATERLSKEKGLASLGRVYRYYRKNAMRRKLSFEISQDFFSAIASQNCHYCGAEPLYFFKRENDNGHYIYNGIDRKNSKEGYVEENCLPCCRVCNRAKSDMSYEDFMNWISLLKGEQ